MTRSFSGASPEVPSDVPHDCTEPKAEPKVQQVADKLPTSPVDLPDGDSYGLGQPGSEVRRGRGPYFVKFR